MWKIMNHLRHVIMPEVMLRWPMGKSDIQNEIHIQIYRLPKVNTVNKENNILKKQWREQVSYLIRCSVYLWSQFPMNLLHNGISQGIKTGDSDSSPSLVTHSVYRATQKTIWALLSFKVRTQKWERFSNSNIL